MRMKCTIISSVCHGGVASTTSWPSTVSSSAAACAAAAQVGIDRHRRRRLRRHRDPQASRLLVGFGEERPLRRRRDVEVARLVAAHHVEERRRIAHGARDRPGRAEPERARHERRGGDAPARRLDAEEPAARRRDADRAAAVAAVRDRREPGCDRGGGAAARAAGRARRVPRVAAVAVQLRLGHRDRPELGRVRLADDREAGVADLAARPTRRSPARCRRTPCTSRSCGCPRSRSGP